MTDRRKGCRIAVLQSPKRRGQRLPKKIRKILTRGGLPEGKHRQILVRRGGEEGHSNDHKHREVAGKAYHESVAAANKKGDESCRLSNLGEKSSMEGGPAGRKHRRTGSQESVQKFVARSRTRRGEEHSRF